MSAFHYVAAFVIAILIIVAAFVFALRTEHAFIEGLRQDLRDAKAAETLPKEFRDVDIETWEPNDFGVVLPERVLLRLAIADFIRSRWLFWIPFVCAVCFGVAYVVGLISEKKS